VAILHLIIAVLAQPERMRIIPPPMFALRSIPGWPLLSITGGVGLREPLFLGQPANHAAKRAGGGGSEGIFLTNNPPCFDGMVTAILERTVWIKVPDL
jgi:hypothetical protein